MRIVFFLSCIVICQAAVSQSSNELFLKAFKQRWQNAKAYTLQVANLMPEAQYGFNPMEEERSFGDQLIHVANNICWLSAQYLKNEPNPLQGKKTDGTDKEAVVALVTEAFDYAMNVLEKFPASQLADTVKFFAGPMTKLQVINLLNDHQTHHRGQLIVYLRLQGIKPPAYVGW